MFTQFKMHSLIHCRTDLLTLLTVKLISLNKPIFSDVSIMIQICIINIHIHII